jgi:hypothetical protein
MDRNSNIARKYKAKAMERAYLLHRVSQAVGDLRGAYPTLLSIAEQGPQSEAEIDLLKKCLMVVVTNIGISIADDKHREEAAAEGFCFDDVIANGSKNETGETY